MAVDLRSTSLPRVSNLCMAEIEIRVSSLKLELLCVKSASVIKVDILSCVLLRGLARSPASASAVHLCFRRRPSRRNGYGH